MSSFEVNIEMRQKKKKKGTCRGDGTPESNETRVVRFYPNKPATALFNILKNVMLTQRNRLMYLICFF